MPTFTLNFEIKIGEMKALASFERQKVSSSKDFGCRNNLSIFSKLSMRGGTDYACM